MIRIAVVIVVAVAAFVIVVAVAAIVAVVAVFIIGSVIIYIHKIDMIFISVFTIFSALEVPVVSIRGSDGADATGAVVVDAGAIAIIVAIIDI